MPNGKDYKNPEWWEKEYPGRGKELYQRYLEKVKQRQRKPITILDEDSGQKRTLTIDKDNVVYDEQGQPKAQFEPKTSEFIESPYAQVIEEPKLAWWQTAQRYAPWTQLGMLQKETEEHPARGVSDWVTAPDPVMEAFLAGKLPETPITKEAISRRKYLEYEELPFVGALKYEAPFWATASLPGASFTALQGALRTTPKWISWLARWLTPAVKVEQAPALAVTRVAEKISQKQTERALLRLLRKMPTDNELKSVISDDWYKSAAKKLSGVPGVRPFIKRIDPTAVADTETKRAILRHLGYLEVSENKGNVIMSLLQRYGDDIALFGVNEKGICTRIIPKPQYKGRVPALGDVLERPNMWELTSRQKAYIKTLHTMEDSVKSMLKAEGISLREIDFEEGAHWVHRHVVGKKVATGEIGLFRQAGKAIGAKKPFQKTRFYEFMAEGINNGVVYGRSASQYFRTYYDGAMRMIADKRLAGAIPGETVLQRMPMAVREEAVQNARILRDYKKLVDRLAKIRADWKAPLVTLEAIGRWDAKVGNELRRILKMPVGEERKSAMARLVKNTRAKLTNAQNKHNISRVAYRKAKERAGLLKPDEAWIGQPAFAGKIYPADTAKVITEFYTDAVPQWLKAMSNFSAASRTLVATADFSAPFIQGLPVLGHSPHIWAKSLIIQFATFFDKKVAISFMERHATTALEMAQHRAIVMGTQQMHEMVAALPMLERLLAKAPGRLGPILQKAFTETYGRFGVTFTVWGDAARIMMWESLRPGFARRGDLDGLARLINHMTGVMSTKAIGIPQTQMAVENAFVFFAPRYTRAGFALFADIFKGGYTTVHAMRAIGNFLAGGTAFYVGTCAALGQEPNLDPTSARFGTIKIGNQHLGIGGFLTSAVRGLADVSASVANLGENEPLDFLTLDRYKNPAIRFFYNKKAPATSLIHELLTRKDFLGRRLETPEEWGRWIADFVTPIALQTITTQEEKANWQAFLIEMQGGRTFPESVWEKVYEKRNELSQQEYGLEWEELDLHQKRMIEALNPRLRQLSLEAREQWAKWYPDDPRVRYEGDMDGANSLYSDQLWQSTRELELGLNTTKNFMDKVDNFGIEHAGRTDEIREHYPEVMEQFERWHERDREDYLLFDQAYDEYIQKMVLPTWQDEFYTFQWDAYRASVEQFQAKWGQKVYDEVRETLWLDDNFPPLFLELKASREMWHEYYDPKRDTKMRILYRQFLPEVDAHLFFWGRVTKLQSREALMYLEALKRKYDIDSKAIPAYANIKVNELPRMLR